MKLFQSYKQRPAIDEHYDVICIGSGLGSLTTASLLARKIFEKLPQFVVRYCE